MGFDQMTDAALLAAAKEGLVRRKGDTHFVPPRAPERAEPLGLLDFLRKQGADEVFAEEKT